MIGAIDDRVDRTVGPQLRVVVADERRLMAEALAALVRTMSGFVVIGVIVDERDVPLIATKAPDVVLAGVDCASRSGFALVRSIRAQMLAVETVIVADALEPEVVGFVLEQRLGGLLLTDMSAPCVASSLDEIVHGRAVMPSGWQRMLVDKPNDPLDSLSERQLEVLRLLADGCSYDQIAARLFITLNTVKFHVRSIFVRLGVGNRMAAARILAEHSAPATAIRRRAAT